MQSTRAMREEAISAGISFGTGFLMLASLAPVAAPDWSEVARLWTTVSRSVSVPATEKLRNSGPVRLREPLELALGVPVAVDNNVRALALAELLLTDAKSSSPAGLLFVKYGPGVGAAWLVGGTPWPGAHFRSGERGHTLVENDGPTCAYCGRRGGLR